LFLATRKAGTIPEESKTRKKNLLDGYPVHFEICTQKTTPPYSSQKEIMLLKNWIEYF
jgi:hypothetical protein